MQLEASEIVDSCSFLLVKLGKPLKSTPSYVRIAERIKADMFPNASKQEGKKLPTQEELARYYGVSRSTIVRVMSHLAAEGSIHSRQGSGGYLSDKPHIPAQRKCLSLVVPDLHAPVTVATCRGVERKARQLGYHVLLGSSEFRLESEHELIQQHLQAGAQGVILYPVTRFRSQVETDYLTHWDSPTPVVTLDIACAEWKCSRVVFDNVQLGYDMTRQLIARGHKHILFMHTSTERLHSSIHERAKGWRLAMEEAGLPIPTSYIFWPTPEYDITARHIGDADYPRIVDALLELEPRPSAVIAWHDVAAAYVIQALLDRGVGSPDEIQVAGFDNEPIITRLFRPLMPTSKPDFIRLGEFAVETLEAISAGNSSHTRTYTYPVPLLWRDVQTQPSSDVPALDTSQLMPVLR
ncbi:hypothetical protein LBMAG21_14100 [Armatimonadota bacterium]|nr:hypothetical protein LBMAG21_14100 [Armatimonadota bacterium]